MCLESIPKYVLLLTGLIIFSSCKKDDVDSPSRTALLTSAPWKLTAVTYHGDWDGDGVVDPIDKDLYAETPACSKDDLMIFNADGSGISDEGLDKCEDTPQTSTFSWSFVNPFTGVVDENVIKFQNSGFTALTIVELNSTTLKVKNILSGGYYHLFTYSH